MTVAAPIEANIGQVYVGKQSALGTIKPTSDSNWIVPRLIADGLSPNVTDSTEEYVDGKRWASPQITRTAAGGAIGTLEYQAQVEVCGQSWAWQLGSDTVTGGSDPYTHTIDSNGTAVPYLTVHKKVGVNVGPIRQDYQDSRASKTVWNCGTGQETAHLAVDYMSLGAGAFSLTDPSQAQAAADAITWPEITGQVVLNGVTIGEINSESITADLGITAYQGDSVAPAALVEGKNPIVRTFETIVTATTLKQMYNAWYGTQTPTGGTTVANQPVFVALVSKYVLSATRTVQYTSPRVQLDPSSFKPGAQPTGGTIPVTFGGNCTNSGASAAFQVVVLTGDATSYIA